MICLSTTTFTHNFCGHASGAFEDYVCAAINAGLDEMGFADHAPLPPELRDGISMCPEQIEEYIQTVEALTHKYQKEITIKLGFEVDFPLFDDFEKKYFTDPRIDYLIGSCHFIGGWAFDHPDFIDEFSRHDINALYVHYLSILEQISSSRLFQTIGHFDVIKKFGHRPSRDLSFELAHTAKVIAENGTAVEINTSGLRKPVREMYPSRIILDFLFKHNVPITLGSDSHRAEDVAADFEQARELLHSVGYRRIVGFKKRNMYFLEI